MAYIVVSISKFKKTFPNHR